ncbi:MAG: DUF58 domain-containing protein [Planctomycetota bacterium]
MIPKELLKKIRRIEIRTAHIVNEALAGQYHSAFKGRGMEFEEVRQYHVGDDVRSIDWNVTARAGEPYVKVFREERELTVMLLVDISRSQDFGADEQLKRELAAELCATLAFSAIKNNDKVGLLCFSDRIEKHVPPRKGVTHVLRVLREVLSVDPEGQGTDISAALDHLNRIQTRRAVVFLISDLQDEGYERALRIARGRHDVIVIDVSDPREHALPAVGLVQFTDAESGRQVLVDTSSRRWRAAYQQEQSHRREQRTSILRRSRVDCIELSTGTSFVDPLVRFFRTRGARR